ncbi:dienelactone hydrolase family protein [Actinomadura rayongensis]|uniref:Dienelactone hydrolase family protein n=1 Tax=Actinomadura rayongensis TaxID=1429076 RepID=A0A6I4WBV0_9ACTN|nr:dienelactone hydrolase family protein [Actinomadura rayongensis]MXQ67108.1 dienelactone hydrolase family protein [Actinomadura rayongensis]
MTDISIAVDGIERSAYLAVPEGEGPWPAVVVLFELVGANADMRAQADRLAANGYLALLPDLYDGKPWIRCVSRAMREFRAGRGPSFAFLEASRAWLAARADCTGRVGVAGFCLGGGFALLAAAGGAFDAAAVNYGILPGDLEETLSGACPVVANYAGRDRLLKGAAAKLDRTLTVLGVDHDVKEYPDAGHGFLTETPVPALAAPLVKVTLGVGIGRQFGDEAWERIFAFFGAHLASGSTT